MTQQYPTQQPQPNLPDPGEPEPTFLRRQAPHWESGAPHNLTHDVPRYVLSMPPTAWQSLPKPVRFAVWLWTVAVIASFVAGVVMAVSFVLGMGLALL